MKSCPDCTTALRPIQIIGRYGNVNYSEGLEYTAGDKPKFGAWKGHMKNRAGTVHGFLCDTCQRVLFYAVPGDGAGS